MRDSLDDELLELLAAGVALSGRARDVRIDAIGFDDVRAYDDVLGDDDELVIESPLDYALRTFGDWT